MQSTTFISINELKLQRRNVHYLICNGTSCHIFAQTNHSFLSTLCSEEMYTKCISSLYISNTS